MRREAADRSRRQLQRLPNAADGSSLFVGHEAEHVERQLVLVLVGRQRHGGSRDDDGERDEVSIGRQAEIAGGTITGRSVAETADSNCSWSCASRSVLFVCAKSRSA